MSPDSVKIRLTWSDFRLFQIDASHQVLPVKAARGKPKEK